MSRELKPGWFKKLRWEYERQRDQCETWPEDSTRTIMHMKNDHAKEIAKIADKLRFLKDSIPFMPMEEMSKYLNEEARDPKRKTNMEALIMYGFSAFLLTEIRRLHEELTKTQA